MQGVVKAFDPESRTGTLLVETTLVDIDFDSAAFDATQFRFLRQGQRLVFETDDRGLAVNLRLGSEVDMATSDVDPAGDS